MRLQQYTPPMPWGPSAPPTHPTRNLSRLVVPLLAVGFVAAVFLRAGLIAAALALALAFILRNRVHRGRTLLEWVAAGLLIMMLAGGVPTPETDAATAPAKAKAAETAGQLDGLRQAVADLWEQATKGGAK